MTLEHRAMIQSDRDSVESPLTSPGSMESLTNALPTLERFRAIRDPEFYCRDIIFQVEGVLFKVSRRPFEEDSEAFKSAFALPPLDSPEGIEGSCDANPIELGGVVADEFRSLLRVLFPGAHDISRSMSKDQWISALKLATMWDFENVRLKAIAELSKLVPQHGERVRLARVYDIPGWIESALKELVQQDTLTASDLEALGWATVAKLIQIRESVSFKDCCACPCNYCTIAHVQTRPPGTRPPPVSVAQVRRATDLSSHIREAFGPELF
ncbi:hypothetical protein C8Q70DRAFT_289643 [Cubamyces menziesii]|nr:hypothetical protein C8Q70DRAFT_289643 [Cubamyces menziesii]